MYKNGPIKKANGRLCPEKMAIQKTVGSMTVKWCSMAIMHMHIKLPQMYNEFLFLEKLL
jgi:hypothetical protein